MGMCWRMKWLNESSGIFAIFETFTQFSFVKESVLDWVTSDAKWSHDIDLKGNWKISIGSEFKFKLELKNLITPKGSEIILWNGNVTEWKKEGEEKMRNRTKKK